MVTFSAISAAFALTSAIVLLATYAGRPEAKWSVFLASAFCIVIAVHQAVNLAFAIEMKLRFGRSRGGDADHAPPEDASARRGLHARRDAPLLEPPSVTESTTSLLPDAEPVPARRRRITAPIEK